MFSIFFSPFPLIQGIVISLLLRKRSATTSLCLQYGLSIDNVRFARSRSSLLYIVLISLSISFQLFCMRHRHLLFGFLSQRGIPRYERGLLLIYLRHPWTGGDTPLPLLPSFPRLYKESLYVHVHSFFFVTHHDDIR